jgi:tellurite resistance protein TerC
MRRVVKTFRKIGVILIGFPTIAVGIALLVLPGPGLLVIALGLVILSLEFDWAGRYLDKVKQTQAKAIEKAKAKTLKKPKKDGSS